MQYPRPLLALVAGFFLLAFGPPIVGQEAPPGIAIVHSSDNSRYVVSPSLIILGNGDYLAGFVWRDNAESESGGLPETQIYRSRDGGATWQPQSTIPAHYGSQFVEVDGQLFSLGTTDTQGQLVICRSADGGQSWSDPQQGGLLSSRSGFETAGSPWLSSEGRVWRCVDIQEDRRWRTLVLSADASSDLLQRSSWEVSQAVAIDPRGLGGGNDHLRAGSVVPTPGGEKRVLLRMVVHHGDRAALGSLDAPGRQLSLDTARDLVEMPGGSELHQVRWDAVSGRYWAVVNPRNRPFTRYNRLELVCSEDLRNWERRYVIAHHRDGIWHGLSQASWQFDGDDLVVICATAWDGSKAAERANYLTFHRVSDFRSLRPQDSPALQGRANRTEVRRQGLTITGAAMQLAPLEDGSRAYNGYNLQWRQVPDRFQGWEFTRRVAANQSPLQVTAHEKVDVFIAIPGGQQAIDVSGWLRQPEVFYYGGDQRNPMLVYSRILEADQTVTVPQGSWAGGIVLIPPDNLP